MVWLKVASSFKGQNSLRSKRKRDIFRITHWKGNTSTKDYDDSKCSSFFTSCLVNFFSFLCDSYFILKGSKTLPFEKQKLSHCL